MQIRRSLLAPLTVSALALASGGWLLQQGASADQSVYGQARLFQQVMQTVSSRFVEEQAPSQLYDKAIDGMLEELGDPHSVFMDASEYDKLRTQTEGEYGGLGIQIDERDGWITVMTPLPETPAARAGILAGDRIIEVDGESTKEWTADQAVGRLRGKVGDPVNIRILRPGVGEPIPFRIVRAEIHVTAVPTAYVGPDGVGYVEISVFSENTAQELATELTRLRSKGMRSLVLDLRGNPGGLLEEGVAVADLFLEKGKLITEMKGRTATANARFVSKTGDQFPNLPVAVLVNPYSASASEIVAGALQDHDRAIVLGQTSFGKGSVQTIFPMAAGSVLKLTTSRWYTPSGRTIQKAYGIDGDTPLPVAGDMVKEDTAAAPEFKTAMGRTVLGGGGIRPDLVVRPDSFTVLERTFANAVEKHGSKFRDELYRFAVRYARSHSDLRPDFQITQPVLEEFYRMLDAAGIEVSREAFEGAQNWIADQLVYQISLNKWGQAEARRAVNARDVQVRQATEILRQAKEPRSVFTVADRYRAGAERRSAEP